jgi:hypothetical protein
MAITNCQDCCNTAQTFYQYQPFDLNDWPNTGRSAIDEIYDFVANHPECGTIIQFPFNSTICEDTINGTPTIGGFYTATRGPEQDRITLHLVCIYNPCYNIEGSPPCPVRSTTPQYDIFLVCNTESDCICDCGCGCTET